MARRRWIQIDGVLREVGVDIFPEDIEVRSAAVRGDYAPFKSPIDGTVVEGRRQFREHCLKHDVVPTSDLKGLPPKQMNTEYKPDRAAIKRTIADIVYNRSTTKH